MYLDIHTVVFIMTKNKFCYKISLFIVFLFFVQIGLAQDHNTFKKELRSLDGSRYLTRSFEAAEILVGQNEYDDALDMLERGAKKAKSMGKNPYSVVLFNKAELMTQAFPAKDEYAEHILNDIEQVLNNDPPLSLLEKCLSLYSQMKGKYSVNIEKKVRSKHDVLKGDLAKEQTKQVALLKSNELNEFKKMDKEDAFVELEKLKTERERLEQLHVEMSKSVSQSKALLKKRTSLINEMTRDQAKKEAIIQYNMRMIDSLQYQSELDSINLMSNQLKIDQQEAILDLQDSMLMLKDSELKLKNSRQNLFIALSLLGLLIALFLAWIAYASRRTNKQLATKNDQIEKEKERSEALLLNILPKFIAQELKEKSKVKTRTINACTVIFTDFINFSSITKQITPEELIETLDECFRAFDGIISNHNIEKIKTIGDSYMCAGGVPVKSDTHAIDAVNAASDMVDFLNEWNLEREKNGKIRFDARIGIHSGPIIAGVVGAKKFAYDIWGDTVNIAARLESQSAAQMINISDSTYQLIKEHFECTKRGSVSVKNMNDLEMYYVNARQLKPQLN